VTWSLDWTASPLWLAVNALMAFRLTRLWVADMLPPLPRLRAAVKRRAYSRWDREAEAAAELDTYRPLGAEPLHVRAFERKSQLAGGQPAITYLVTCYWCSGYWWSLLVFLGAAVVPTAVWAFLAVPLAFSAVTGLLAQEAE
jgi:hypothetical protein